MNYGELQTAVIEDTHRPDLANLVPRFIRESEDMIRREMTAYMLTTTLQETDRSLTNSSQYSLPDGVLVIRRVAIAGSLGSDITRIALGSITSYTTTQRVAVYVQPGDGLLEFRGTPPADTIFDLNYFGMPARLVADTDTNSLLDENETLYKAGAMFYLYQNSQDRELASDALDVFNGVVETLNEQIARKIGGAKITASYQFGGGGGY
jgi:hypothetical protein